ncbi:tetratricopeptide repeat protein [Corallococcus interemptor]|nr:tetratricopeptide repeat protein [Corallococcus interemptor]
MAPSLPAPPSCAGHPDAAAGWRCVHCDALLCPACVETRRMGTVEYAVCSRCGGTADVLLRHRSHRSLAARLPGALRFPFTGPGLQTLVAVVIALTVLRLAVVGIVIIAVLPLTLALGVFWASFFALVRGAARGEEEPEAPGFSDIVRDNLAPGLTGLCVSVGVFVPALVRAWGLLESASSADVLTRVAHPVVTLSAPVLWTDPLFWGLAVLGVLWLPWALLVAAMSRSVLAALNPLRALACIRAVGRDARLVTGVFLLLTLLHGALHGVAEAVLGLPIVLVPRLLAEALTCLVPFAAANVLGLVLYVHGDVLDYLPARDFLEPALGDTSPMQAPPVLNAPVRAEAAGVENPEAAQAAQEAELAAAVEARDVAKALALYGALLVLPRLKVSPAHHLFIGQAAAVEGDFPLSVKALEAAADSAPDAPTAPRALVLLARVQGEKMGNTVRAEEIYRYILHRYPDTEAARFAHARLAPAA